MLRSSLSPMSESFPGWPIESAETTRHAPSEPIYGLTSRKGEHRERQGATEGETQREEDRRRHMCKTKQRSSNGVRGETPEQRRGATMASRQCKATLMGDSKRRQQACNLARAGRALRSPAGGRSKACRRRACSTPSHPNNDPPRDCRLAAVCLRLDPPLACVVESTCRGRAAGGSLAGRIPKSARPMTAT